jgi:quinol monooxygenase YgiN
VPNLTVVARVVAMKDCEEAVKTELLKLIVPTREENGCIEYNLHQDNDDPAVFVFYETWESTACLEAHMNSEHFRSYVATVNCMIEEKIVHKMTRIA